MRTESSILIKGNLQKIFEIVQDVEKYSEFMPQFKEAKIYPLEENKFIVERKFKMMLNIPFKWKSLLIIKKNESIKFEHIEGMLKGMKTEWIFEVVNNATKVKIIHQLPAKIPLIGNIIARKVIWDCFIKKISYKMLVDLKGKIESQGNFGEKK